ncbi:MAG TPA: hypothetical protein VF333_04505 [Pyrinomonadaceae bacterium]
MKRLSVHLLLIVIVFATNSTSFAASSTTELLDIGRWTLGDTGANQAGPTLLKASVIVRANRLLHYWKAPDTDNFWSWMPEMSFVVVGPINTGSAFVVDFTNETGTPWYTVECETPAIDATRWQKIVTPAIVTHIDKRTTLATGTFGFTIRLKNELSSTNQTVFSGKFKVAKFHIGNDQPAFKNQFEYYVDQDWNLPIGYLYFNTPADPNMPPLKIAMWFRGELDNTKLAAYLFYNGKQIGSTKDQGGAAYDAAVFANAHEGNTRWERWTFSWGSVRGWNTDTSSANNASDIFFMNQKPGEYEVKVLRDGDLARSAKFTVGPDGRLVDNGITQKNTLGGLTMILPVKVIGAADGQWDPNAWKTGAFYGNPLTGFVAP